MTQHTTKSPAFVECDHGYAPACPDCLKLPELDDKCMEELSQLSKTHDDGARVRAILHCRERQLKQQMRMNMLGITPQDIEETMPPRQGEIR